MDIKQDDLMGGEVIALLEEHLADMYANSPPDSVHALDHVSLQSPEITFFSAWDGDQLLGCVAIKQLTPEHSELKSMRTSISARKTGVATHLLNQFMKVAAERGYRAISLETGAQEFFRPARQLYKKHGFSYCPPFSDY